jgi:signal transduction histidine kinase
MHLRFMLYALVSFVMAAPVAAQTEKDAVAMVEKAIAVVKSGSDMALIDRINAKDRAFVNGELYAVVRDTSGTVLAHPTNINLVGKNLNDMPDANGKLFQKEIINGARTQGRGWVSYKAKNPVSKKVEGRKTYYQRTGDIIVEAHI